MMRDLTSTLPGWKPLAAGFMVLALGCGSVPATQTDPGKGDIDRPVDEPSVGLGVNSALQDPARALVNSNLVSEVERRRGEERERRLQEGRRQARERAFDDAEKTFVSILAEGVVDENQRAALLELAMLAQERRELARAQQILSQYLHHYPQDPGVPEILLRQGLIYRQMGAPVMALSKFYAVMTSSLRLRQDRLEYYQQLVLQAQTEIADTYYFQGRFEEAAEFFNRLLKLDGSALNKAQIHYKQVRSLAYLKRYVETAAQAELFVARHPDAPETAEVRFLMAEALKELGRRPEAVKQVLALLSSEKPAAETRPETWTYWQQRTGNEIANQLYKEGDYLNALQIYTHMADLDSSPGWQMPVWYQMGLVFERLNQPTRASELYARILSRPEASDPSTLSSHLATVLDMARWRKDHLRWLTGAERAAASLRTADVVPDPTAPAAP